MEIFCIFYGLIEFSNSIYVYKGGKNNYNLYITCIWALSFVFLGIVKLFGLSMCVDIAYILFGLFWFPMAFTPCIVKIFRADILFIYKKKVIKIKGLLIRKIIFFIIGMSQFMYVLY